SFSHTSAAGVYPFPYTTLFRSLCDLVVAGDADCERELGLRHVGRLPEIVLAAESAGAASRATARARGAGLAGRSAGPPPRFPREDRKSTRLNSSHVKISYAVFC